jgi:hypothetical protein
MATISNKIYSFADAGGGSTRVTVQSTYGLNIGDVVEILRSINYQGTFAISNITSASFDIVIAYVTNEQGSAWQVSRARPVLVNPEGETVDTLRQAVNQISEDVGNKFDLNNTITDKRDLVKALNSLYDKTEEDQLKSLMRSIATN